MSINQEEAILSLIRIVVRGFYPTNSVLVVEALLWHKVLTEDDCRQLLTINPKELKAIFARLIEDRLIVEFKQREQLKPGEKDKTAKEANKGNNGNTNKNGNSNHNINNNNGRYNRYGSQRYITRSYFFIHYSIAIDSIKWKVDSIVRSVDQELSKINEKGFICPRCKKRFTELDVQSLFNDDFTEVYCNICNTPLVEDDFSEQFKSKHEKSIHLKSQLDPILQYLKKIDEYNHSFEDNSIDLCFLHRIPASDNGFASYTRNNKANSSGMFDKNSVLYDSATGNKSLKNNKFESTTIRVSIAGDNEDEVRQREELNKMKLEKAEQNELPSWYQESTVGKKSLGSLEASDNSNSVTPDPIVNITTHASNSSNNNDINMLGDSSSNMQSVATNSSMNFSEDTSITATSGDTNGGLSNTNMTSTSAADDELASFYERLKAEKKDDDSNGDDNDDDDDDDDFDDFEDI